MLLVYDVRCHRAVAKSLSDQLLLIETLIEPVLRGSAVVGLGFGRQGTGIERLVNQIAQDVRLLGHIDRLAFFAERGSGQLVADPEGGHSIVHIARHDGLRRSL